MADDKELELDQTTRDHTQEADLGSTTEDSQQQSKILSGDKETVDLKKDWQEIRVADVPQHPSADQGEPSEDHEIPDEGQNYEEVDGDTPEERPQSPPPPPLPEKDDNPTSQRPPESVGALPSLPQIDRTALHVRSRSETESSQPPASPRFATPSINSVRFVVTALEQIDNAKEAKKRKPLHESVKRALNAVKEGESSPDPEIIFEPLRLATDNTSVQLTNLSLDCIGKLISSSYFSTPTQPSSQSTTSGQQPDSLIDRAIETICDCFQDEATPPETQLQIVKSLLAAVLNDQVIVHGQGLLKAVRQVYNIFLISKSPTTQQIAQGTLTQMVGTVFERVTQRLSQKEARINLGKLDGARGTASGSQTDLNGVAAGLENVDLDDEIDEVHSEGASTQAIDQPVPKKGGEKLTLQNIENAQGFDDRTIADSAPTMVTPAKASKATRIPSGRTQNAGSEGQHSLPDEDEEDEIYVKDAFLVFRSMCKLSYKELPPEQQQYVTTPNMRQKLVSLAVIRSLVNNHTSVFTSPLCTIRGGTNGEPTSFGQAINQYLRLSVSRNAASAVRQVFEIVAETFWLMLKEMRVMLKGEIELFLKEIYLAILERKNAPSFQKLYVMKILKRLSTDPRALVEIYLNYDCESTALDNMFQRTIEHLSRMSITPVLVSAQTYHQYIEQYSREADTEIDWRDHGRLPPPLTTAALSKPHVTEWDLPTEFLLKQQALDCLVRTLRSLVNWAQDNLAVGPSRVEETEDRLSTDYRQSLDRSQPPGSPRMSSVGGDTPQPPGTPLAEDDPLQFEKQKLRKTALLNGIRQFNFKPKRGVKTLLQDGFIKSDSPEDIAAFITQNEMLDKAMIGEYLGEGDAENVAIMHAFVDSLEFARRRFVDALRTFLQSFRLPGEAQKIDRFMLKFAERYMAGNPNAFANADTAYVLAYSVIMLNTDQHSQKMKGKRMTPEDFIKNNRGINDNADLPDEYLNGIYDEIAHNEIVLSSERETAAKLGIAPAPTSGGIASRVGQAFLAAGRDLQREAHVQASEEMSRKTEQRLRSIIKSQRRTTKQGLPRFVPATSFKHVGPMFDVTWMSFFSGLSGQMQSAQNLEVIKLCMEGMRLAIRIACIFDLDTPRTAFITALSSFTNLDSPSEMQAKNFEALKILLEVALTEGNLLKASWRPILTCVSQLDRFQLVTGGVDEKSVPNVNRVTIDRSSTGSSRRSVNPSRPKFASHNSGSHYDAGIAQESRSSDMVKIIDRIFTSTAELSGDAIVHFVRALSEVSMQEIQSSGQSDAPRTYSLQKLVEISYYNMTRVRFEWSNIWQVLGEHFNDVGCRANAVVVFFALDSLRQLSMRFMELEELPGFKFQKDFLKPFEHVMANSTTVPVKDMVLRCLIQMIQARGENIRSGWKTMFGVFTVAAREPHGTFNVDCCKRSSMLMM